MLLALGRDFDRVEMTSLLKDATFEVKNGKEVMFKNTKKISDSEKLTRLFEEGFVSKCSGYAKARLFVALGPGVYDILLGLKERQIISAPIIAMAHPSGANIGRIGCYLGIREPKDKSYQWCVEAAKEAQLIIETVEQL